eukprot:NODE_3798_length_730_cov_63.684288_g3201_i0.p1 GENE.NODE_3798_length_730_cov_63.684288_g3201_i0~~NODE_3798_length_730_cov_63.684288_g3201_i0.p1  ORF type:complete len:206 (-),score=68.36 NODE_3798_length_730_cov_63.684288_g3201_i0:111-698(-)
MQQSFWETYKRDFWHQPLLMPLFALPGHILHMERGSHFPFYVTPWSDGWDGQLNKMLKHLDVLVEAHEDERNNSDQGMNFYKRADYVRKNFHRYSNPTLGNLMFDTQARKCDYDRINSVASQGSMWHYASMMGIHSFSFMYMTYFLRYRRISAPAALAVSFVYYHYWQFTHTISYKVNVDIPVINAAKRLGYEEH